VKEKEMMLLIVDGEMMKASFSLMFLPISGSLIMEVYNNVSSSSKLLKGVPLL
jgi:hypothetical protein